MNKEPVIQKLSDVLENVEEIYYGDMLFLKGNKQFTADTLCAVFSADYVDEILNREDDDLDQSKFAKENGLHAFTNIGGIQDIKSNAKQQRPSLTQTELLEAFNFYYTHDAFINFDDLTK